MVFNEPTPEHYSFREMVLILQILECLLSILILPLVVVFVRILLAREFCHPNLRLMLVLQTISQATTLVLRIIRHGMEQFHLLNPLSLNVVNGVTDFFLGISTQIMALMAFERVVAMYFSDIYEDETTSRIAIVLSSVMMICIAGTLLLWFLGFLPFWFVYSCGISCMMMATVIFIILPFACRRAYERVAERRSSTVSQRFHTARNLKSSKLLVYLSPYKCFTNFLSATLHLYIYQFSELHLLPLLAEIYWLFNLTQLTFQMLLTLFVHDTLKGELQRTFGCKTSTVTTVEVRSVVGARMMFNLHEEEKLRFDALAEAWKSN